MNKFHGIDLETSPKWLKENIIVISEGGSHSYGLATETSDLDLRGIAIEPKSHVLGFSQNFEQFQYVSDDVDVTIFGLRKFCKLASACNPNVLELLFVEPHSIKFETGYYNLLRENRQLFLSQKAKDTFLGYAISQLHKIRLKSEVGKTGKRVELIEKFGFDCYSSDTEFLTEEGWKQYNLIKDEEKIGTFNKTTGHCEFQNFSERVSKKFTGKMAEIKCYNSNCFVTLNHRMFLSKVRRSRKNNFSTKYEDSTKEWEIIPLQQVLESKNKYYNSRISCDDVAKEYPVSDDYLKIMGAYISEGCVGKRRKKSGDASVLRFSQKVGGRLCFLLDELLRTNSSQMRKFVGKHKVSKSRKKECIENIYTLANREISKIISEECGNGSKNKKLPNWCFELSTRQVKLLLKTMIDGDGTYKKFGNFVYYTTSKQLADDIQKMCVISGIVSNVRRQYGTMYQILIDFEEDRKYKYLILSDKDSQNVEVKEVVEQEIVCFTVPNEILITRRNGKVAIHGNTKHGLHLVRLLKMCEEILTTGELNVFRKDREELLAIRNGSLKLEDLIKWADSKEKEIREINSILPKLPDIHKIDKLCIELLEKKWDSQKNAST